MCAFTFVAVRSQTFFAMSVNGDPDFEGGDDSGTETDATVDYGRGTDSEGDSDGDSDGTVAYSSGSDSDDDPWGDYMMVSAFSPEHSAAWRTLNARRANIRRWKRHEAEVCACGMRSRCWRLRQEVTQCWYMDMKQVRENARGEN